MSFLSILKTRGPDAIRIFHDALVKHDQQHLAVLLKESDAVNAAISSPKYNALYDIKLKCGNFDDKWQFLKRPLFMDVIDCYVPVDLVNITFDDNVKGAARFIEHGPLDLNT